MKKKQKQNKRDANVKESNPSVTGSKKLKLENYSRGKKLPAGKYISVFDSTGNVKLLGTSQLLPTGLNSAGPYSGSGQQLIETFNPQYGGGYSTIYGRFSLQHLHNYDTDYFGWLMFNDDVEDQEIEFLVYMGSTGGQDPTPVQNFVILEVHVFCVTLLATLTMTVNGAEVKYQFEPVGEGMAVLIVRKPSDSNFSRINIKLKTSDNAKDVAITVNKVERYVSLLTPPGNHEILEI